MYYTLNCSSEAALSSDILLVGCPGLLHRKLELQRRRKLRIASIFFTSEIIFLMWHNSILYVLYWNCSSEAALSSDIWLVGYLGLLHWKLELQRWRKLRLASITIYRKGIYFQYLATAELQYGALAQFFFLF